jgi:hypothetical protein
MPSWTCLNEHPGRPTVWRVDAPGVALVIKQHRHPRPFEQELRAYRDWLPRLTLAADDAARSHAPLAGPPPRTHAGSGSAARDALLPAAPPHVASARAPTLLAHDARALALAIDLAPGARLSLGTHDSTAARGAHAAAGRFARALHALAVVDDDPVPLLDAVSARLAAWHGRAAGLLSPAERDGLDRLARRRDAFADARRVACHRDFTPDNWLLAGASLSVLDFEHARLDAAEVDLVKLRADVWPAEPALADAFLGGYGPLTVDAAARLDVLLGLHAVATLAWAERHDDPAFRALGRRALDVALASA